MRNSVLETSISETEQLKARRTTVKEFEKKIKVRLSSLPTGIGERRSSTPFLPSTRMSNTLRNENEKDDAKGKTFDGTLGSFPRSKSVNRLDRNELMKTTFFGSKLNFSRRGNVEVYANNHLREEKINEKSVRQFEVMMSELETALILFQSDPMKEKDNVIDHISRCYLASQSVAVEASIFKSLEVYFMMTYLYRDYRKTLFLIKQYKSISTVLQNDQCKMKSYKWLAIVYQEVKEYEKALINLKKLLRLSWVLDDKQKEIFCYDSMGKCYYYIGDMSKSKYFHERMSQGIYEPYDSPCYKLAKGYYSSALMKRRIEKFAKEDANKVYISSGEEDFDFPFNYAEVLKYDPDELKNNVKSFKISQIINLSKTARDSGSKIPESESLEKIFGVPRKKKVNNKNNKTPFIVKTKEKSTEDNVSDLVKSIAALSKGNVGTTYITHQTHLSHLSTNRKVDNYHTLKYVVDHLDTIKHSFYIDVKTRNNILTMMQKLYYEIEKDYYDAKNILFYKSLNPKTEEF